MRNGKYSLKRSIALLLALAVFLLAGCSAAGSIREDSVHEDLPVIDPDAGVANDTSATLYYRLRGESYLAGVNASVHIGASERAETAIIRELLAGTPEGIDGIEPLFPENVTIESVSLSGDILYVTLSQQMLSATWAEEAKTSAAAALENGYVSAEEYDAEIERIDSELYETRRLAVYSLVNTVTEYNPNVRVQLMIYMEDSNTEVRVQAGELGLADETSTVLLEPQGFNDAVIAYPETVVSCTLQHLMNGEYEQALSLMAETVDGIAKPSLSDFSDKISACRRLMEFEIIGSENKRNIEVTAGMTLLNSSGGEQIEECVLTVVQENGVYRLSCASLLAGLEGMA